MVHPELTSDPVCMQGEIGKICEVAGPDEIHVRFDLNIHGKYMPSALLIVLPPVKIVEKLRRPGANIPDWQQALYFKSNPLPAGKRAGKSYQIYNGYGRSDSILYGDIVGLEIPSISTPIG